MISTRILKYVLGAVLACVLFNMLLLLKGKALGLVEFLLSFSFGAAFQRLLITRLPVFRNYYQTDPHSLDRPNRAYPNAKSAAALSTLFSGGTAALVYMLFEGDHIIGFAFISAVAAGIMSFYEPGI